MAEDTFGYDPAAYGERFAALYDEGFSSRDDPEEIAAFLAARAGSGPALELGIGTGNVALPLARRGVAVQGVDASPAMLRELRAKPGAEAIAVTLGDFTDVPVDGAFPLIYLVFNTLFLLPTQVMQARCLRAVAAHLANGGIFVLDAFVPDLARYTRNQSINVDWTEDDRVMFTTGRLDPVAQRLTLQHVVLRDGEVRLFPVVLRYIWPAELDLMARQAGLHLRERYAGWRGEPFAPDSPRHVSVYVREQWTEG